MVYPILTLSVLFVKYKLSSLSHLVKNSFISYLCWGGAGNPRLLGLTHVRPSKLRLFISPQLTASIVSQALELHWAPHHSLSTPDCHQLELRTCFSWLTHPPALGPRSAVLQSLSSPRDLTTTLRLLLQHVGLLCGHYLSWRTAGPTFHLTQTWAKDNVRAHVPWDVH